MSDFYKCKPSEVVHLDDAYTAFCFDEACMFIALKMQEGLTPNFNRDKESKVNRREGKPRKGCTPLEVYAKFEQKDE